MNRPEIAAQVLASHIGRRVVEAGKPGALIRMVREALGWSQCDLSRETGYSQPTISRLERDQGRIMDMTVRARIADVLCIPRSVVGLVGPRPSAADGRTVDDMRRSDLLRSVLGAAAAVALPIELSRQNAPKIGMETVQACADALDRLILLDDRHGGAATYALATSMFDHLKMTLERATYTQQVGDRLRAVTASACETAGWLAFDAGKNSDARRWWLEALHHADLAPDPNTRVVALLNLARLAGGREALNLIETAQSVSGRRATPRMESLLKARLARGYARVADRSAALAAISEAERLIGTGEPEPDDPTWLNFWGPADLAVHRTRVFLNLDDPARAHREAERAVKLCDATAYARNHAMYSTVHAIALVKAGEVDRAIAVATPIIAKVNAFDSGRLTDRTKEVVRLVGRHQQYRPATSFTTWANQVIPA